MTGPASSSAITAGWATTAMSRRPRRRSVSRATVLLVTVVNGASTEAEAPRSAWVQRASTSSSSCGIAPQRTLQAAEQLRGVSQEAGRVIDDQSRARQQCRPGLGQRRARRAPVDQLQPQMPFQAPQPLRDRRLGEAEAGGGVAEVSVFGHRHEIPQMSNQIHCSIQHDAQHRTG